MPIALRTKPLSQGAPVAMLRSMHALAPLILDLGTLLLSASLAGLMFRSLNLSPVLGYILAGLLLSPQVSWLPTIHDPNSIHTWGEIGVIFLLFALGLEFSFRKLLRVGWPATVIALVEVLGMIAIGEVVGGLLGWDPMSRLFLGGALAISSTTIIVKAFAELQAQGRKFHDLVLGVLIVEDLVAVVLLVVFSASALGHVSMGPELLPVLGKVAFFIALWLTLGVFVVPSLLRRSARYLSDELVIILSLGICLSMAVWASSVGLSPALGAFIIGSIFAETNESHRIEKLITPLRDLFASVFFVYVGTQLSIDGIQQNWGLILTLTMVTVTGKFATSFIGGLLAGQSATVSLQSGLSLAQIGEFSFIIAGLGLSTGLVEAKLYPVAVAVSVLTTLLTPFFIRLALRPGLDVEAQLPARWKMALHRYRESLQLLASNPQWSSLLRAQGIHIGIQVTLVLAIHLGADQVLHAIPTSFPWLTTWLPVWKLLLGAPFLWALVFISPARRTQAQLWESPLQRPGVILLEGIRWVLAGSLVQVMLFRAGDSWLRISVQVTVFLVFLLALAPLWRRLHRGLRQRFERNLKTDELENTPTVHLPWDNQIAPLEIPKKSPLAGKTLKQARLRELFLVTVVCLDRDDQRIWSPDANMVLLPEDKLFVFGADKDIAALVTWMSPVPAIAPTEFEDVTLECLRIQTGSYTSGRRLDELTWSQQHRVLILGVERGDSKILSPSAEFQLQAEDLVWVSGSTASIQAIRSETEAAQV